MTPTTSTERKPKLDLKPLEVGVGAGAAVLTAVATSYLGTAGTLTGAAAASVIGTVSTSVLRTSAQVTNESLARTTSRLRQQRPGGSTGSTAVDPATLAAEDGDPEPAAAAAPEPAPEPTAWEAGRSSWRRPSWWALAAGVVAAFVLAVTAITGIEALAGKPLAAVVNNEPGNGTTLNGTVDKAPAPAQTQSGSTTTTPTAEPSATGTGEPTVSPSPDASPTPQESTPSPTSEPPATTEPSATQPTPTGGATPAPTP